MSEKQIIGNSQWTIPYLLLSDLELGVRGQGRQRSRKQTRAGGRKPNQDSRPLNRGSALERKRPVACLELARKELPRGEWVILP